MSPLSKLPNGLLGAVEGSRVRSAELGGVAVLGRRRDQEGGGRGAEPGREGFRKKESGEAPPAAAWELEGVASGTV